MGWPIPNIKQMFTRLGRKKAKYFAVVDLTQGYHQISLSANSRTYAAFVTDMGVYEPKRIWMGLKTAPSYFQQQLASIVLAGLLYDICELYIDDIIIHGRTEVEFLANLDKVFRRFEEYLLTLNPEKCILGVSEIEYVGHVINDLGLKMSDAKIRQVLEFPLPKSTSELRSFAGLANYFRDHIQNFSSIAHPLYNLIANHAKRGILKWDASALEAFQILKNCIEKCPTLFFMDDNAPIFLHTDASQYGIGAYLFQM
jgi:hypothetical protein